MASKLTPTDKQLLSAGNKIRIGNKPYENGIFGSNPNRDFVLAKILNSQNAIIESTIKPYSEIELDAEEKLIIKPVQELNNSGIKSGRYNLEYNFLRRLAGSEDDVLVKTVPNEQGNFDIFENLDAIEVTDEGIIYEKKNISGDYFERGQELQLKKLTLLVDAISSTRTEVRLKTQEINGRNNFEDFSRLGESVRRTTVIPSEGLIQFGTENDNGDFATNTNVLTFNPEIDGFLFTPRMVGGTIYINDVFLVDTITTIPTTENNVVTDQETLVRDDMGDVVKYGDLFPWDSNLHANAVKPVGDWAAGWMQWLTNNDTWANSVHLGYWSHWVQGEGRDGGVCMKFPDINSSFAEEYQLWPFDNPHRPNMIGHTWKTDTLLSLGISAGDNILISGWIKSSVPNKPLRITTRYANELLDEPEPSNPPEGFFVEGDPATEEMPTSPPDGYIPATVAGALAAESIPDEVRMTGQREVLFFTANQGYGWRNGNLPDLAVGDTSDTFNKVPMGTKGTGAWKVISRTPVDDTTGQLAGQFIIRLGLNENWSGFSTMEGTLSDGGEFKWNGTSWERYPEPSEPAPIVSSFGGEDYLTVNPNQFPTAVNAHPYVQPYHYSVETRRPLFPRERPSSTDFEYGCGIGIIMHNYLITGQLYSGGADYGDYVLLGKQDLIWATKIQQSNSDLLVAKTWDQMFPLLRTTFTTRQNADGEDEQISYYEDIFQFGRVQSIVPARLKDSNYVQIGSFIIFYNDGLGNDTSNKGFRYDMFQKKNENDFKLASSLDDSEHRVGSINSIKDFDEPLNNNIIDNDNKVKWTFHREDGVFRYYAFAGDQYYRTDDGDGDFFEIPAGTTSFIKDNYPRTINDDGFDGMQLDADVVFERDINVFYSDWSRFAYLKGNQIYDQDSGGEYELIGTFDEFFIGVGTRERNPDGVVRDIVQGTRNPGNTRWLLSDDDTELDSVPLIDNGVGELSLGLSSDRVGVESPEGQWIWSAPTTGIDVYHWRYTGPNPPRYNYVRPTSGVMAPTVSNVQANEWEQFEAIIPVPENWKLEVPNWSLVFEGFTGNTPGIIWVDDVDVRFQLTGQTSETLVKKPFVAQITSVSDDGKIINVDKTFEQAAIELGDDDNPAEAFLQENSVGAYRGFDVSYTVFNPKELRTYLKFGDSMFLTTNFRQDRASVVKWPHSIVFKLYNPLPPGIQKYSECTVVKEMIDPLIDSVRVVEFEDSPIGDRLLRSPSLSDINNPIERRTTQFKNEGDILTSDGIVSGELKNKIVSASRASAEINVDYTKYENFSNFSSVERRLDNFKYKLELIESYNASSASLVNVSGSTDNRDLWDIRINDVKNNFDGFEKYMYFQSSSYASSSLGVFYDNAWPKVSGGGTLTNPYVLAHTTSSEATTWFNKSKISASLYDEENGNRLSGLLPQHIIDDSGNTDYLKFTDMIAHHFDNIWIYIKSLGDVFDRREKLSEGISKDLLYSVGRSLGWKLNDSSDLVSLPRFFTGNEVTGSSVSTFSAVSQQDITRELWSRIINNMPFFLKHKGTVKALKGLINIYGIPSTILRVKEYGGPNVSDDETPQFEITRKFTKALDFKGAQYISLPWSNDSSSGRKPDTIEFRFRAVSSSNHILVEKKPTSPNVSSSFYIRLKDNGSSDDYGYVSFQLSGSDGLKEIQSSEFPVYDGDFYSVMLRRTSGSDSHVTQSFQLSVGKYDVSRSKLNLFSAVTMSTDIAASSSYNISYANDGTIYIGGSADDALVGSQLSGSIMEYRHWTETLGVKHFKNHIANPKAYEGNSISSSYSNLVLRYSFDDNKDLSTDTDGIRDVSSNQTSTVSGSHNGFTGNFFRNVVDEQKSHIPSIGALRRSTNKVRIEDNNIKPGQILSSTRRVTDSRYDTAPNDSNKVGIWFAPTDVINNDIINSVGDLNFENYLGDPRDKDEISYRGLKDISDNYWQKYTEPNNFWDYIRLLKFYDSSLYPQLRKLVPARAKSDIGVLVEPNIFERPKVIMGKKPSAETKNYRGTINMSKAQDSLIVITGSYNAGVAVSTTDSYSDTIRISNTHESGSAISITGSYDTYDGTISEVKDRNFELSLWQRLGQPGLYVTSSITQGDVKYNEARQPIISGSRIYGRNQKVMKFYSTALSASLGLANSSSFYNVDLDTLVEQSQAKFNSFYAGVKNTINTTVDGGRPIEITITSPTKLVTQESGDSTLKTGDGKVADFKFRDKKQKPKVQKFSDAGIGADGASVQPGGITKKKKQKGIINSKGKFEKLPKPKRPVEGEVSKKQQRKFDEGKDDGVLNNEK